jgi:hypothetical protein
MFVSVGSCCISQFRVRTRPLPFSFTSPELNGRVFLLRSSTVSMAGSDTVYLEDVEVAKSTKEVKPATAGATATTGVKRQRTLAEMFGGASQPEPSAAKKQRLSQSTTASASASSQPSAPDSSGSKAADAVPFSIASFQESLSDEQKELLSLECEVMGRSWQVTRLEALKKQLFITVSKGSKCSRMRSPNPILSPLNVSCGKRVCGV